MRSCLLVAALGLVLAPLSCDDATPATPPSTPAADGGGADAEVPKACAPVSGVGTKHDAATVDETWTAAASPHVIETSLSIPAGHTITIEPCAVVRLSGSGGMIVEGKLLALGTADKRIVFERAEASSAWRSIETRKGAEVRLAYVDIDGGGKDVPGALDLRGDQETATQPILFVDHVNVKGSESVGVNVREGGGFAAGSSTLAVTGSKSFPISIWGRAAGTLPTGPFTGNGTDEILLPATGGRDDIREDTTFADRGVPYRVGASSGSGMINVAASGSVPLLTIEAGVTLRFSKGARLVVDATNNVANGALAVLGTAARPVVFTSAEATPAAGDWVGLVLEGAADARTKITYAQISYAGASSQVSSFGCPSPGAASFSNDAAIVVAGGLPSNAFVTNTAIANSAGEGIVRGWTGDAIDFLPTNTFSNIARCNQTFPKPAASVCPDPAPCPK